MPLFARSLLTSACRVGRLGQLCAVRGGLGRAQRLADAGALFNDARRARNSPPLHARSTSDPTVCNLPFCGPTRQGWNWLSWMASGLEDVLARGTVFGRRLGRRSLQLPWSKVFSILHLQIMRRPLVPGHGSIAKLPRNKCFKKGDQARNAQGCAVRGRGVVGRVSDAKVPPPLASHWIAAVFGNRSRRFSILHLQIMRRPPVPAQAKLKAKLKATRLLHKGTLDQTGVARVPLFTRSLLTSACRVGWLGQLCAVRGGLGRAQRLADAEALFNDGRRAKNSPPLHARSTSDPTVCNLPFWGPTRQGWNWLSWMASGLEDVLARGTVFGRRLGRRSLQLPLSKVFSILHLQIMRRPLVPGHGSIAKLLRNKCFKKGDQGCAVRGRGVVGRVSDAKVPPPLASRWIAAVFGNRSRRFSILHLQIMRRPRVPAQAKLKAKLKATRLLHKGPLDQAGGVGGVPLFARSLLTSACLHLVLDCLIRRRLPLRVQVLHLSVCHGRSVGIIHLELLETTGSSASRRPTCGRDMHRWERDVQSPQWSSLAKGTALGELVEGSHSWGCHLNFVPRPDETDSTSGSRQVWGNVRRHVFPCYQLTLRSTGHDLVPLFEESLLVSCILPAHDVVQTRSKLPASELPRMRCSRQFHPAGSILPRSFCRSLKDLLAAPSAAQDGRTTLPSFARWNSAVQTKNFLAGLCKVQRRTPHIVTTNVLFATFRLEIVQATQPRRKERTCLGAWP